MGIKSGELQYKKRDRGSWWDLILPLGLLAVTGFFLSVKMNPLPNPSEWVEQARVAFQKKNYAEALENTLKLLTAFPKNHVYLDQAATLYFHLGKRAEEAEMLERFMSTAPEPSEACPRWPEAFRAQKNYTKMLEAAKHCLSLEPNNSDFILELGLSFERAGQSQAALEVFKKGALQFPEYWDFSIGHARVLLNLGESQKAWDEILIVMKARPELSDAIEVAESAAKQLGIDPKQFDYNESNEKEFQ